MHPLQFTDATTPFELAYSGSYSVPLVILSALIAILAAFTSISYVDLMRATQSVSARVRWHLFGAVAMGIGVWTMHFVGMVAFRLPLNVYFSPGITFVSILPAIAAGYIALNIIQNHKPSATAIMTGGTVMGLGIGVMHYIGMGGMRVEAEMLYQPGLFVLSILVAVVMASGALSVPRLMTVIRGESHTRSYDLLFKLLSASLMGLAIASLHYVAMDATVFLPLDGALTPVPALDETLIAGLAVIACVFILVMSTIIVIFQFRLVTAEKIAQASERALDHQASLQRISAGIAHHINNLMTVVIGSAASLAEGGADRLAERRLAENCLKAGRRAAELSRRLAICAGQAIMTPASHPLDPLLDAIARRWCDDSARNVDLEIVHNAAGITVYVDHELIVEAVLALLYNGQDALQGKGSLKLIAMAGDNAPGPGFAGIAVVDSGSGMTREVLARAREPFFSTGDRAVHSGLGLSLAEGAANSLGGNLTLKSRPGEGTTATIWLPLAH